MKSPFGPVEVTVKADSIYFKFSECKVNGVEFRGSLSVLPPDGSDNKWTNKFRVKNDSRCIYRVFPDTFKRKWTSDEDRLSDNGNSKINSWACAQAAIESTPIAVSAAKLALLHTQLNRLHDEKESFYKELERKENEIAAKMEEIANFR